MRETRSAVGLSSPYVGPRPFGIRDREVFFGRDREACNLADHVLAHSEVLLYSQSGAGKSSLINARLVPILVEQERCEALRPAARVQGGLKTIDPAKIDNIFVFHALMSWAGEDADEEGLAKVSLREYLGPRLAATAGEFGEPCVAVFDQFEELFTSEAGGWRQRRQFFEQVRDALSAFPRLRVLFAMREEYIAELDPYAELLPERLKTRYRLERMRGESALSAVIEPMEAAGRPFPRQVAEQLVRRLLETRTASNGESVARQSEFVELVQLQVVCQNLWDALGPGDAPITEEDLNEHADVDRSLTGFYERCVLEAAQAGEVSEGAVRLWFERRLITRLGTRALVLWDRARDEGVPNAVIDLLNKGRHLIRVEERGGASWYELSHDRFIDPIRESNRHWRAQYQKSMPPGLEQRARKWRERQRRGVPADGLLLGERSCRDAESWLDGPNAAVIMPGKSVRKFVLASRTALDETEARVQELANQRRVSEAEQQAKTERRWSILLSVATLMAVGMATVAWIARGHASAQTKRAEAGHLVTTSALIAFRAQQAVEAQNPELGVELARQAAVMTPTPTPEAETALRRALAASRARFVLKEKDPVGRVQDVAYSPDGRLVVTASIDNKARVWDAGTGRLLCTLSGHEKPLSPSPKSPRGVLRVLFSGDSRRVITAGADGRVRIWDAGASGDIHESKVLPSERDGPVSVLSHSPDGNMLATATRLVPSMDGAQAAPTKGDPPERVAEVWDLNRGAFLFKLPGNRGPVTSVTFCPDSPYLVTTAGDLASQGSTEGSARLWRRRGDSVELVRDLPGHRGAVLASAFSPDGKMVVTAGGSRNRFQADDEGSVRIWEAESGKFLTELRGHKAAVLSVAFSRDGKRLVTASCDRTARIWEAGSWRSGDLLRGHTADVYSAAFSRDGQRVLTASYDGTARIWEAGTGDRLISMNHGGPVPAATFSPDGTLVATASWDGTARIWKASKSEQIDEYRAGEGAIEVAAFSPDGTRAATGNFDGRAMLRTVGSATSQVELRGEGEVPAHHGPISRVAFSADGDLLVTASWDRTARVWEVQTGRLRAKLEGHTDTLTGAAFSPDGRLVVTTALDNTTRVWDAETGKPVDEAMEGHAESLDGSAFRRDGRFLVVAAAGVVKPKAEGNGDAQVWGVKDGRPIRPPLIENSGPMTAVAFSPDGKWIAAGSADAKVRVWEAMSGREIKKSPFKGHMGRISRVVFSSDSRHLATEATDGTARVWDLRSGTARTLTGLTRLIPALHFDPHGRRLVTEGERGVAKVWDLDGDADGPRRPPDLIPGHTEAISAVAFDPEGRRILTASWDRTARISDAKTGKEQWTLRGHEDRLTAAAFSPDGTLVLTGSYDGTVRLWDSGTGEAVGSPLSIPNRGAVTKALFSPDGKLVMAVGQAASAWIWSLDHRELPPTELSVQVGPIHDVAFSPDSSQVVTVSGNTNLTENTNLSVKDQAKKQATVWEVGGKEPIKTLNGHGEGKFNAFEANGPIGVTSVGFSPDDSLILTSSDDGTARLWEATEPWSPLAILPGHTEGLTGAWFSRDATGSHLITAGRDNKARIWDVADIRKRLGKASRNGPVELETDDVLAELIGHRGDVTFAALDRTGRFALTFSSQDGMALVWDVAGKTILSNQGGITTSLRDAAFSLDGRRLITADSDGTARVFANELCVPVAQLLTLARNRPALELTDRQRKNLHLDAARHP